MAILVTGGAGYIGSHTCIVFNGEHIPMKIEKAAFERFINTII